MSAREAIAPGSLADRILRACPAGVGATLAEIVRAGNARPEDVRAEVNRLRRVGYLRTWGKRRGMRYFRQLRNLRRTR